MLKLLLDEHISPEVAKGLRRRDSSLVVYAMVDWEGGNFLGQEDSVCLTEAAAQRLILSPTTEERFRPCSRAGRKEVGGYCGVIFVDEKTISPADIGGLIRGLRQLIKETRHLDWTNGVRFLRR